MSRMLSTKEAAVFLGVQPATLRSWRCSRIGPPYIQLSPRNVRYAEVDLERYAADRRIDPSNKEYLGSR